MISELVLATRNAHKLAELVALFSGGEVRIRQLDEFPDAPEVVEDGATCEANAIKKARIIAAYTGVLAVSDDTGLMVDALGGAPGVYSARYAGAKATYDDNCRKLLHALRGIPLARRTARFETVVAMALPSGQVWVAHGTLEGVIAEVARGTFGFGYDAVFLLPEQGRTLAELSLNEKNQISHRARAFKEAQRLLCDLAGEPFAATRETTS